MGPLTCSRRPAARSAHTRARSREPSAVRRNPRGTTDSRAVRHRRGSVPACPDRVPNCSRPTNLISTGVAIQSGFAVSATRSGCPHKPSAPVRFRSPPLRSAQDRARGCVGESMHARTLACTAAVAVATVATPAAADLRVTGTTVPSVTVGSVATPEVRVGSVATPSVTTPVATVPAVETPQVAVPAVRTPSVSTPSVSTSSVSRPSASTPSVSTPSASTPSASRPAVRTPPAPATPASTAGRAPGGRRAGGAARGRGAGRQSRGRASRPGADVRGRGRPRPRRSAVGDARGFGRSPGPCLAAAGAPDARVPGRAPGRRATGYCCCDLGPGWRATRTPRCGG